jgi:ribosome-binding protein aMBF1 (putative translation factor)
MASFYPELYQTAVALLVEAREKAGLTQESLAAWFGQSETFVSSYEEGACLDPSVYRAGARDRRRPV